MKVMQKKNVLTTRKYFNLVRLSRVYLCSPFYLRRRYFRNLENVKRTEVFCFWVQPWIKSDNRVNWSCLLQDINHINHEQASSLDNATVRCIANVQLFRRANSLLCLKHPPSTSHYTYFTDPANCSAARCKHTRLASTMKKKTILKIDIINGNT